MKSIKLSYKNSNKKIAMSYLIALIVMFLFYYFKSIYNIRELNGVLYSFVLIGFLVYSYYENKEVMLSNNIGVLDYILRMNIILPVPFLLAIFFLKIFADVHPYFIIVHHIFIFILLFLVPFSYFYKGRKYTYRISGHVLIKE